MPTRKSPARDPAATRARILAAAERLFAAGGFDRVSMPDIAAASGITAGAIYRHFASKDALFFEVVKRAVAAAPMPSGDLADLAAAYTEPQLKHLRQMAVEVHHASAKHPRVRRLLRSALDAQIAGLGDGIAAAQRDGHIEPGLDANLLANAALIFIVGLMHMETIAPALVGNNIWRDFVRTRMTALLGAHLGDKVTGR
jgi:AcrR family transcriptional regulator